MKLNIDKIENTNCRLAKIPIIMASNTFLGGIDWKQRVMIRNCVFIDFMYSSINNKWSRLFSHTLFELKGLYAMKSNY